MPRYTYICRRTLEELGKTTAPDHTTAEQDTVTMFPDRRVFLRLDRVPQPTYKEIPFKPYRPRKK